MKSRRQVVAIIPAHNEELTLLPTIESLQSQTRVPDQIIVISDNSTDHTVCVALTAGVSVGETENNTSMKAGALNQALDKVIDNLAYLDVVVVVDADSVVGPNFVERAIEEFDSDPLLGGVSGSYEGKPGGGYLGWLQRQEYARWAFDDRQRNGKTVILSGAASAFTVESLIRIRTERTRGAIARSGSFYNENSFTEDFELSLAMLHCGIRIKKMTDVVVLTSYKPTWKSLYVQRRRWDRGITETLLDFGITYHTRWIWFRRCFYALQVVLSFYLVVMFTVRLSQGEAYQLHWFWLTVFGVMALEKATTVWRRGWKNMLAGATVFAEMPFDFFLQLPFLMSLVDIAFKRDKSWR